MPWSTLAKKINRVYDGAEAETRKSQAPASAET